MFKNEKRFILRLLTEGSEETRRALINYCNLPKVLKRTLIEYYVVGLEIKEIADDHSVDDRTVKRWKQEAIEVAEDHFANLCLCHFNDSCKSLLD
jgi:DNA-directed RNA polymerase specialized sigma24 family protein